MYRTALISILTMTSGVVAFALPTWPTSPLPQSYSSPEYIYNFNYPAQNLICPPGADGCGGGFQANIANNPNGPGAVNTLTTVWCVDYQLDVTYGSQYTASITNLANITTATDNSVRYGNLTSLGSPGNPGAPGWAHVLTDPTGIDGNLTNSAAYRYTLAAALVSQYEGPSPSSFTNPSSFDTIADVYGSSSGQSAAYAVNTAIQEAVWYITYNYDYSPRTAFPSFISTAACPGSGSALPTGSNADNPMCWVQYAEDNANTVKTGEWAVVSGPANATTGALEDPVISQGYSSYQTFLVQVSPIGSTGGLSPTPEPGYYVLLGVSCIVLFVVSRQRRAKIKAYDVAATSRFR